ncbi:MAG: M50 family metallopeptidase [Polyangiaceae bacterium]
MPETKRRFHGGWLHFSIARVPTRIHFSAPLGAIFFSQFQWIPGFWLGFIVLILMHELGHAAVAKLCGLPVSRIDVHGLGGVCWSGGRQTPLQRALVSWGGVWAQLIVFGVAFVLLKVPLDRGAFLTEFLSSFLWNNLILAGINLIPMQPFDGADAWTLPKLLKERWTRPTPEKKARPALGKGADVIDLHERVREITEREARRVREERDRKRLQ